MIKYNPEKPQFEDMETKVKRIIEQLEDMVYKRKLLPDKKCYAKDIEALEFAIEFIRWGFEG